MVTTTGDASRSRTRPPEDRIVLPPPPRPQSPEPEPAVGPPEAPGLVRRRISGRLDEMTDLRLGVVTAMPGSGKTTALAHWARSTGLDVAWWSAMPSDDPVAQTVLGLGHAYRGLTRGAAVPTDWSGLARALGRYESPLVIVIDDAHHAITAEVADQIQRLLLTTRVRLVLATRIPLPLNLARSELPGMVIHGQDLRFRPAETCALFHDTYRQPLSEDDARALTRCCAGWPAALHMFHHAVSGDSAEARHRAVRALPGNAAFVGEYVATQVLDPLAAGDRVLLTRTSPLETLTADRCDELLGASDSADRLLSLTRRGIVEETCAEYRLNPVVRARCRAALRAELGGDGLGTLLARSARLLERDRRPAAAVRALLDAGASDEALRTLSEHGADVVSDPDLDWLDRLPPDGTAWLGVGRAIRLLRDGRLDASRATLGRVEGSAPSDAERLASDLLHALRQWTSTDVEPADVWYERLRTTLRRPDPTRTAGAASSPDPGDRLHRALEHAVAGDLVTALRLLDTEPPCDTWPALLARLARAVLTADIGRARHVADDADRLGITWVARVATGVGRSDASEAIVSADARGDRWGALLLAGQAAVCSLRTGCPDAAAFDELVGRCSALEAPALEAWARSGRALAALATGAPDAVHLAEAAVGLAQSADVAGACAVARATLALARSESDQLRYATAAAERAGLGCRPWEWADAPAPEPARNAARDSSPPLDVRCFGGFALQLRGADADLAAVRPRSRAVLRMLALHAGRPVHRDQLIEAMWPQLDPAAATHNLHVAVSSLRTALEPNTPRGRSQLLVRDADRYTLRLPESSTSDLRQFDDEAKSATDAQGAGDNATAIDHLQRAIGRYVGEVLPEEGPAEWVLQIREYYQVRAAEAAGRLAQLLLGSDCADDAAAAALRSVEIDPCRDGSWRLLIAANEAAGDLAAAQHARRSYADVLTSLGVVESATLAVHATG